MPESVRAAPKLLVSVRNVAEGYEALAGGADIIDVKEPERGSLGRADSVILAAIARDDRLAGRALLTCALGELAEWEKSLRASEAEAVPMGGWHALKVGLAGERRRPDWRERTRRAARALANRGPLVPVAYADAHAADAPSIPEVAELASRVEAPFLLIDTFHKDGKSLWDWLGEREIGDLAEACGRAGIGLAVAGSLGIESVPRLVPLAPAVIAVRGAACVGSTRMAAIDRQRVRRLKTLLTPL